MVCNQTKLEFCQKRALGAHRAELATKHPRLSNGNHETHRPPSIQHKKSLRILGWYHSHPKITVQPSHVDLRTQINWQRLDKNFVGVILAAFNRKRDLSKVNTHSFEIAAFQSKDNETTSGGGGHNRIDVLVEIIPKSNPGDKIISRIIHVQRD